MKIHALRSYLTEQIELAKKEDGINTLAIANSQGLSADTIHGWFPDMKVGWDTNKRITISWK